MSAEEAAPPRVVIIGLDGATFDLILPWVREEKLPNLARLLETSSYGRLRSTHPPATFPAWTTFMTGTNPGKHGIFDFTLRQPGSYAIRFVNSTFRKGKTIWQILSESGKRVGVIGVPATYPPEAVNGFMICGFDSPVTTGIDSSFIYPENLYGELKKEIGTYAITDFQELRIGKGWHDKALSGILRTLERKAAYTHYLLNKEPWDCFMVLFGESDTVSHHFWMFHDPQSPRYDPDAPQRLKKAILTVYQKLDGIIGSIISRLPEDGNLLLLSDHGSGGTGRRGIHLNRWLEQQGYLSFKNGPAFLCKALDWSRKTALAVLPSRIQEQFFRRGSGRIAGTIESLSRFGRIRWEGTSAYSEELNYFPSIWINLKGREPRGVIEPGESYQRIRDELIGRLGRFTNPATGEKIVKRAYRREEVYQGGRIENAPDIILELNDDQGYSYSLFSSTAAPGKTVVRTIGRNEFRGAKGKGMNGSHRMEGMFLISGPSIVQGRQLTGLSLADVAPTILYLLGCMPPSDMDGTVIENAFTENFLAHHPICYRAGDVNAEEVPPRELTPQEEVKLRGRLKGMGYL